MKLHRIYGITLRYIYLFKHSYDRLTDVFYWPAIDLLLWGVTSAYIAKNSPEIPNLILMIVSGIAFWLIVYRAQYEVTVNMLSELWDRNLINIFVSPLKFSEWITSFLVLGVIKSIISFVFVLILVFFLYNVHLINYGWSIVPFFFLLTLTGWWVGFIVASLILRWGSRVQTLAWAMVFIISPFSAIYYPLSVLPDWAEKVAFFIPTSYVFEGSREVINTGVFDANKFYIALGLNLIYLLIATLIIKSSFKKALERRLIKVF